MTRPFVAAALAAALISLRLSLAQPPKGKDKKVWPADALNPDKIGGKELADAGDGDPNKAPVELVAVQTGVPQKGYRCAAFSPDGKYLVMGTTDGKIVAWDLRAGTLASANVHKGSVLDIKFNPNGKTYATSSSLGKVAVRSMTGGGRDLPGKDGGSPVIAFSPDGKSIAIGFDNVLRLQNFIDPTKAVGLQDADFDVTAVAFSADGKWLAAGSREQADGRVWVWDAATGKTASQLEMKGYWVKSLDFRPDGTMVAGSQGYGKHINLWNPTTGKLVRKLEQHTKMVNQVAFTPSGDRLISCGDDQTVRVWNPDTGAIIKTIPLGLTGRLNWLAVAPDGRHVAVVHSKGMVYVLRLAD